MTVTGKDLHNKIRTLCPDHSSGVTPEILERMCEEPAAQPFLKWFCENISQRNVITEEELRIKQKCQNAGEWLEETELDKALEEAVQDCPELSKLIPFDPISIADLTAEFEIAKESQAEDEEYEESLRVNLRKLKALEIRLDECIEEEQTLLEKEQLETEKTFKKCSEVLEQLNRGNQEFLGDVEDLLAVYIHVAENREPPVILTQMPVDLFAKQLNLYDSYLNMYIKRQFGITDKSEQEIDSHYSSFETKEGHANVREFMMCKRNLANAHTREILAKVFDSHVAPSLYHYVQHVYNEGDPRVPRQSELRTVIDELTAVRDSLEEDVSLLRERQLIDAVQHFAEIETAEALKYVAETRLARRNTTLENTRYLQTLTREQGHLHADLLYILMGIQFRRLKSVGEFIPLARQYLLTEYSLSSARCESMKHLIEDYGNVVSQLSKGANSFHKYFSSLIYGDDTPQEVNDVFMKYNEVLGSNKEHEEKELDALLNTRINALFEMEADANSYYLEEIHQGPTHSLESIPCEIRARLDEASDATQSAKSEVKKIRERLKEQMRADAGMKREIDILWQRFLADPDTLKSNYIAAKKRAEKTHFGNTYESQ